MALQFSETAPGVHTAAIINPKTDRRHNVAIIESCDAWQLFIDGELAVRDMPSFKAAAAEAQAKVMAPRTSNMVRAACILVLFSVTGASAIGMTKVLAHLFSVETTVAAVASDTKNSDVPPRFTRVRPPVAKSTSLEQRVKPKPQLSVEEVVVTLQAATKVALPLKSGPKATAAKVDAAKAEAGKTAGPEAAVAKVAVPKMAAVVPLADETPSSPDSPVLGLKPIVPRETGAPVVAAAASARITANLDALPPVVISVEPGEEQSPRADADTQPAPQPRDPVPVTREDEVAMPPLPAKAPDNAAPLIRSARAPIEPQRLTSILAKIEKEAEEPVLTSLGRPQPSISNAKRRIRTKRGDLKRARRVHRVAPKRHARRERPVHRAAPARRMVCFAHTCRFQ